MVINFKVQIEMSKIASSNDSKLFQVSQDNDENSMEKAKSMGKSNISHAIWEPSRNSLNVDITVYTQYGL